MCGCRAEIHSLLSNWISSTNENNGTVTFLLTTCGVSEPDSFMLDLLLLVSLLSFNIWSITDQTRVGFTSVRLNLHDLRYWHFSQSLKPMWGDLKCNSFWLIQNAYCIYLNIVGHEAAEDQDIFVRSWWRRKSCSVSAETILTEISAVFVYLMPFDSLYLILVLNILWIWYLHEKWETWLCILLLTWP